MNLDLHSNCNKYVSVSEKNDTHFDFFLLQTKIKMGIKDLYKVINELAPTHIKPYHFEEFTGTRFAIDISIFLYKHIRTSDVWINSFILLLCNLKKYGIKPVCIFDGENKPIEKKKEQDKRREETKKMVIKLEQARQMRVLLQDDYIGTDKKLPEDIVKKCKELIGRRKMKYSISDYSSTANIVDMLTITIEKLARQSKPIGPEHTELAMNIVKMLGMPCIQYEGEAETLCAYLAINGYVDAVLTEDTDVLAYGTPIMVAFKDFKLTDEKLNLINLPALLDEMDLNQDEFRDLCILLSCDYNDRVKGFPPDGRKWKKPTPIGYKKAICMIQEYRNLENACEHIEDSTPLKYHRCRELFTIPKNVEYAIVPHNKQPNYEAIEQLLRSHRAYIDIEYIKSCWNPVEMVFMDESSEET
jgi:flap endonuclease-1